MAAPPSRPRRRRPRRSTLERPVNARTYRGTWLLVGLPLLVAAFSVSRPAALPAPAIPPTFDGAVALELATELATRFPDRSPGSPGAADAARWMGERFELHGLEARPRTFEAELPGPGRTRLTNLVAVVPGRSDATIVVSAHRDNVGTGRGASDNASGSAALVELARTYSRAVEGREPVVPTHRIVFLSTDGGAFGGVGAMHFAEDPAYRDSLVAVVNLDTLATAAPPRLVLAGDRPRSPPATLVHTAAARILEQTGDHARHPNAFLQILDLGFPFSLHEQAPFLARGIPAITITTGGERPPSTLWDSPDRLDGERLAALGRSAQQLLVSLDDGVDVPAAARTYVYFGPRALPGWAVELVLIAAVLPFLVATVDLFARCRRHRIRLAPALRSYRSRLAFWFAVAVLFAIFGLLGAWPAGIDRPPPPEDAALSWPLAALALLTVPLAVAWLVTRERLLPRRPVAAAEELAGTTAALLVLGVLALLVIATNTFALVFLLPSLHAWLWLPHVRERGAWARFGVLAAGFAGPVVLLASLATRFGAGLDAPWYLLSLVTLGYVDTTVVVLALVWLAAAGQASAIAARRYAPYPGVAERPPRGPIREVVRRTVLAARARRRSRVDDVRALGG
jgi:hypothetical protein